MSNWSLFCHNFNVLEEGPVIPVWPGVYPPVAGPDPNPYPYPNVDSPCDLFRQAYRYAAGAYLKGDFDFGEMLHYIPELDSFLNISGVTPSGGPYTITGVTGDTLHIGEHTGTIRLTRASDDCGDYAGVTEVSSNIQYFHSDVGLDPPLDGSFGVTIIPGKNASNIPLYARWGISIGGTDRIQVDLQYISGSSFYLKIRAGDGDSGFVAFDWPGPAVGSLAPAFVSVTWSVSPTAGGGMTATVRIPDGGISLTATSSGSYPRGNIVPASGLGYYRTGMASGAAYFGSYVITGVLLEAALNHINEAFSLTTGT